jgi:acetyl-CoA synthetase (ADP-forming)
MRLDGFYRKNKRKNLTEYESRQVLEKYKIPLAKSELVKTPEQAVKIAKKIGYPIVLKIVSPDVVHKTDVGGIVVKIKNEVELIEAYEKILKNVKKKVSRAKIHGMLVQKMVGDGLEIIVGGKKDAQFGQTVMFGLGGIFVEVFGDVSFRVVPIEKKDALEMMQETKGYKILKGYRGKKHDVNAVADVLVKVSKFLEKNDEVAEMDINPLIVLPHGAVGADARIIVE